MRVTVLPARAFPVELAATWSAFQLADPVLASPFFRPEYTALVASIRPDVFVGVLEDDREVVGFFPFQRDRFRVGRAVGCAMANYQGVIARRGADWDARELVKSSGLVAWEFNHLLASQQPFASFQQAVAGSPRLDLASGFDAYAAARNDAGSKVIGQLDRRTRMLEREVGPMRLEWQASDPAVLSRLLQWKDEHHRRTHRENILRIPWVSELLAGIANARDDAFSGVLTALYAGDHLVAAHLGPRSRTVLHGYVISYDRDYRRYSPGMVMILNMARTAPVMGVQTIDLGKGEADYKCRLATSVTAVAEGVVEVPSLESRLRHARLNARDMARRSPLAAPLRSAFVHARHLGWIRD